MNHLGRCQKELITIINFSNLLSVPNVLQAQHQLIQLSYNSTFFKNMAMSRISSIKMNDSMAVSSAPGFSAILCPSHPEYSITNICKSESCIEPLCPECIPKHVRLHEETKKQAKIETLVTARVNCIQRLAQQKFYVQADIQKLQSHYKFSAQNIRDEMDKKLIAAKSRITRLLDKLFQKLSQSIQVIYSAYLYEYDRSSAQLRQASAPLMQYLTTINTYKAQLQSQDFISALIQLLSDFPKRPDIKLPRRQQSLGSVEVDEKTLEDIQKAFQKYVRVNVNCKQQRVNNLMNVNSNNTKFSRVNLEKSRSIESKILSTQKTRRTSIFGNNGRSGSASRQITTESQVIPWSQMAQVKENHESYKVTSQVTRQINTRIIQPNYFKSATGSIVHCQEKSNIYFKADISNLEKGFEKIQLLGNYKFPEQHRAIVTPYNEIFVLGGRSDYQATAQVYTIKGREIIEQPRMITDRMVFGCCYNGQSIYVAGGITAQNSSITSKFEKFDVNRRSWSALRNCIDSNYGCQLVSFNHMVVKVGGRTQNNIIPNQLELYNTISDVWSVVQMQVRLPFSPGLCQVSPNELLLFGGVIGELRQKQVYKFEFDNGSLKVQKCCQLYSQSSFMNPSIIHNRQVIALQNSSRSGSKNIIKFMGNGWKFISC